MSKDLLSEKEDFKYKNMTMLRKKTKKHNQNWLTLPDHSYSILII